jgi:hypothetical protein
LATAVLHAGDTMVKPTFYGRRQTKKLVKYIIHNMVISVEKAGM